jgi:3-oxoadipate enol-lactonase
VTPFDVDASPVAWREAGPDAGPDGGNTVVFLHGLGGSRIAWEPQLGALGDRWRCVAWDMPGYGASQPLSRMTFPVLADAVVALLDTIGVDRAALVGLSMGGMVALHVALAHPDRVTALALLDTSPSFGFDGITDADAWTAARLAPLDRGATPAAMADEVLRRVAGPALAGDALAAAVAAMSRISPDGLRVAITCLPTHDVRDRLPSIVCPTLVVCGELDTETPPSYSRFIAEAIPGGRLEMIAEAGHLSNLEAPAAVNMALRQFLSEAVPTHRPTPTKDPRA